MTLVAGRPLDAKEPGRVLERDQGEAAVVLVVAGVEGAGDGERAQARHDAGRRDLSAGQDDGDLVALVEVVPDVPHIVPVDFRNVHEPGLSPGQLYECSKISDPNNRTLSDSSYFCQVTSPLIMKRSS